MINPLKTSPVGLAFYRLMLVTYHYMGLLKKKPELDMQRCRKKATEALSVCLCNGFTPRYCLLADMSLHSGVKRLAVWDFESDKVLFTTLVSHGSGSEVTRGLDTTRNAPRFSDTEGSLLSSLGVYRISERYVGKYGPSYRLDGLQATDSAARRRAIVIHAYRCIPDFEIYPHGVAESAGCPAVSNRTMRRICRFVQSHAAALYIYE